MLDLVFLVLMVIVLMKSLKGDFNLTLCSVATVVGVLAAILGIIALFFSDSSSSYFSGVMNIIVLIIAFLLKPTAKHFAKLYQDKIDEEIRSYYEEEERAKENFFRKAAPESAYLHAAERGAESPGANAQAAEGLPRGYTDGMSSNTPFPHNVNASESPMAPDGNSSKMEGTSPKKDTAANREADENYGLPYDLSAPIDLNHGIDNDFSNKN